MKWFTTAVAAATCTVLVLSAAPTAQATVPTGTTVGFVHTDAGWAPAAPDTSAWTAAACTPKLHADSYQPDFTKLVIGTGWMTMDVSAYATAYVAKWDCGSRAIIAAFRMRDLPLYSLGKDMPRKWEYAYGEDLASHTLRMVVRRDYLRDEPTFTGELVVEAGAWWGKPDPVTGQMVYYPAGCVEQHWLYTIVAWSNSVQAQPVGPELPCAQPPLPGTPELL